ncbi:hypothetical protein GJ496_002439 [Pomphorhynchus laevis]|nr:hypothetical protein GJ496_002439 [Pomphorhynchus laevis]
MKELGLFKLYKEDKSIRDLLKEVMALPLLNPERIQSGFEECKRIIFEKHQEKKCVEMFFQYISNTFIYNHNDLRYHVEEWSVYTRIKNNQFLTTNTCESWNSSASTDFPRNSPDLVTVIMYLRTVEVITKMKINEKLQSSVMGEVRSERKKQTERKYTYIRNLYAKEESFSTRKMLQMLASAYKYTLN